MHNSVRYKFIPLYSLHTDSNSICIQRRRNTRRLLYCYLIKITSDSKSTSTTQRMWQAKCTCARTPVCKHLKFTFHCYPRHWVDRFWRSYDLIVCVKLRRRRSSFGRKNNELQKNLTESRNSLNNKIGELSRTDQKIVKAWLRESLDEKVQEFVLKM